MTTTLKATLARLVEANDVESLEALLETTANRNDKAQVKLAVSHAVRRSIKAFAKQMSPAPVARKSVPALNPAVFSIDAESARLFALIANA